MNSGAVRREQRQAYKRVSTLGDFRSRALSPAYVMVCPDPLPISSLRFRGFVRCVSRVRAGCFSQETAVCGRAVTLLVGWRRSPGPDAVLQFSSTSHLLCSLGHTPLPSWRFHFPLMWFHPFDRSWGELQRNGRWAVKLASSPSSGAAAASEIKSGGFELRDTCWA